MGLANEIPNLSQQCIIPIVESNKDEGDMIDEAILIKYHRKLGSI